MKPRLLDLFCCAGGATKGYQRAGFYVVGVDIEPQPNYCGDEYVNAGALGYLEHLLWRLSKGEPIPFNAIHASPPCQAHSALRVQSPDKFYPDLIDATRSLLKQTRLPYVIENVERAPLDNPVILCGSVFGLSAETTQGWKQLRRHRAFECSFSFLVPPCQHEGRAIGVHGGGPTTKDRTDGKGGRSYQGTASEKAAAMGIDWMGVDELNEALPPEYTEYIGQHIPLAKAVAA